ncbi:elongation of very long chain fatty acids protein 1-like [Stegodyphus dumicola]|uniref:elongation of very long chain fatty acids protein 1-like n=1 Tax=Stegodyphus dumicola TaxID=202533 RepID=UPI0015B288F1|nr:elongation of very long chain fatty acids protein 1-like [Stegodyphus dumicola]XP_035222949.1 elongation of very long chain fatty acids protein 1-like [Stegodyphus dumicola]
MLFKILLYLATPISSKLANFVESLSDCYDDYLIKRTDPAVMNWPLVSNDALNFFLIFCYVSFVLRIGPAIMKNREAYDLRWLMVPYNAALVIMNFYIFWEYAKVRWSGESEDTCTTLEFSHNPKTYRLAEITWWFYLTKYIELTDTVFFVLRKKERQLSKLHIIHHSTIPIVVWSMLRSEPGGYNSFFPLANSFVHVIMYTYYGVAAIGDHVKVHLWFKKYITMTQMIQFVLVLYYMFSRPFYGCQISYRSLGVNSFIAAFFFVLFCNFYIHEYWLKQECNLDENVCEKRKRK